MEEIDALNQSDDSSAVKSCLGTVGAAPIVGNRAPYDFPLYPRSAGALPLPKRRAPLEYNWELSCNEPLS
jgi:hypothetical protein